MKGRTRGWQQMHAITILSEYSSGGKVVSRLASSPGWKRGTTMEQ
ncbi:MAG TPA: hypothetical protein VF043_39705 [Ktedonobacteraceae bacterium]